ncbi:VOC family protein [Legionella hackeliae]|uniref:Glyoxalase/bleomycin resistance protein/dioxygenase n=1 Tax=Legionella hackeliae TaxID=449 RepID=A0A0A8UQJ0_LEGHA|nr:VOC family protein [Legionella hackeliae]KTD09675.1 bleomycin resistance protein [Legionella hackeliae]CEK11008.1 Glyoxalase/bleomycin resistance protein/dioxygenase [Legionella hackeliae]STX47747.1 bleomycin resistance protein [Legionella hackeliae]
MFNPNCVIFYVNNPAASSNFYKKLLNQEPVESSPTFAMFSLKPELKLGLWSKPQVEPVATLTGGGTELGISVDSIETLKAMHKSWLQQDVIIVQEPVQMDFGFTFVAQDPDGHRIRVYKPHS